MSRDFIGSSQGRSFLKSPNRDRVTRAIQSNLIPQINYLHVRLGFFDYCLSGESVVSNNRYSRCKITTTRVLDGVFRVDVILTGNGYMAPYYETTNPSNIGWPAFRDYVAESPVRFKTSVSSGLQQVAELEGLESLAGPEIIDQSYSDIEGIEHESIQLEGVTYNQKFYVRGVRDFPKQTISSGGFTIPIINQSAPINSPLDFSDLSLRFSCWKAAVSYQFASQADEGSRAETRLERNSNVPNAPLGTILLINGSPFTIPYFACRLSKLRLYRTTTSLWTTDMPTDPYYSYTGMNPGIRAQVACDPNHQMPDGILYPPPKALMQFRTIRPGRLATPIPPFVKDFVGGPVPTCF